MSEPTAQHIFQEGDIIYSQEEGKYYPAKILKVDVWPDGNTTWHEMLYEPQDTPPNIESVSDMKVQIMHAPLAAKPEQNHFLVNIPVTETELAGYDYYLEVQ